MKVNKITVFACSSLTIDGDADDDGAEDELLLLLLCDLDTSAQELLRCNLTFMTFLGEILKLVLVIGDIDKLIICCENVDDVVKEPNDWC